MPNRKIHNKINRAILGKDYDWINKIMDAPSQFLGKKHRKVLHHPIDALWISALTRDPKAGAAVLLHSLTDSLFSSIGKKPKNVKYFKKKRH